MQIFSSSIKEINISQLVEKHVMKNGGSYIDAVLTVCEVEDIDLIIAAKDLSKPIREKLEVEGTKLNILPRKKSNKGTLFS